mgnify:CR=1 FL=1
MKEVYVKMHIDHAKDLVILLKELSDKMYIGDDWETRSTLEERVLVITSKVDISRGIERFEKRIKRAWQALFFLVLLIINKTGGKNA